MDEKVEQGKKRKRDNGAVPSKPSRETDGQRAGDEADTGRGNGPVRDAKSGKKDRPRADTEGAVKAKIKAVNGNNSEAAEEGPRPKKPRKERATGPPGQRPKKPTGRERTMKPFKPRRMDGKDNEKREREPERKKRPQKEAKPEQKRPEAKRKPTIELEADLSTAHGRYRAAIARAADRTRSKMSVLEIEDHLVEETSARDGQYALKDLVGLIKEAVPRWEELKKGGKGKGVAVLFVASTTRCLEAQKVAKAQGLALAKLWARHMDVEDQGAFLGKSRHLLGVGTPGRLVQLVEQGLLPLDQLKLVVVDGAPDVKGSRILDINFDSCLALTKKVFRSGTGSKAQFVWLEGGQ
ncbi:U3-containing 90S pre-ribosomal complex subunit-domain containing protein [Hyaloraphidium curvatum]|nr:U3-containing 90S pre-ribosomal complex subunit-domain containing protein [Hyaloraphidium curvatum]